MQVRFGGGGVGYSRVEQSLLFGNLLGSRLGGRELSSGLKELRLGDFDGLLIGSQVRLCALQRLCCLIELFLRGEGGRGKLAIT